MSKPADAAPAAPQDTQTGTGGGTTVPTGAGADGKPANTTGDTPDGPSDIVITGSRIANPNLTSTVPITTVTPDELTATASVSIGDQLNDLPSLQSTFSQSNSTRFLGTSGLNLLDLRGLGTQRTLVLLNGRRHVGSDILNNAVSPDVNTFPTDLIERVEIITGGNSAVYGSDALAGVVNFVLKDNFEGVQLRGQGSISDEGDAGSYYASILAGTNFAGGRGNVAIDLEYDRQNSFYASDRDYYSRANGFVTVDSDSAGNAGVGGNIALNSDGNPDAVFFRDIRSGTINELGLVAFPNINGACGRDAVGRAFTCNYIFNADGTIVPETGSRVGLSGGTATVPTGTPGGAFIGGNGNTRREGQTYQILPQLERYSANLIGHFEISKAFVPFIEAKYVRTDSFGQGTSGPAFFTGSTVDAFFERPRLDNPFLSTQARGVITGQLLSAATTTTAAAPFGVNPLTGAVLTATSQASTINAINAGTYRFILRRNQTDLGVRSEAARRETYRIVGGVRGTFNGDWRYEVSANYGEFSESTKVLGNVNIQRELLALDATRDGSGNVVCRSKLDGGANFTAIEGGDLAGNPANLANDIAACVPYNPFGSGASAEARNYITQDTISRGKITQFDVTAFISGDTSGFFNLPGGPIGFALGGEYRRETAFFREDPLVEAGYTFYNAIAEFSPPAFDVKEAFAEIRLPILKDLPFAQELTITGAGRVSNYKGSAGTVYTYNAGIDYAPIKDIRFRAQYGRAIRAPNLSDLYSPQSQNFAPGFADPCSARNIASGTQFRAANCAAAGIPAAYDFVYAQSLEILSGGNPNLDVEKSDSYTYGAVFTPTFIPGLSLSADYYNIKVNNVITAPSAQGIVNSCYDSPTPNSQFCALFQRAGAAGADSGEEPFRIIEGSLQQTLLNYAKLKVRGVDVDLGYQRSFGGLKVSTHLIWTHALENSSFTDPTQPDFADTFLGEVGVPKDAINWNINASAGPVFANYQLRYLSKMSVGAIENHTTFQNRPPQNSDDYSTFFYPDVFYMDLRFGFNFGTGEKSTFYIGVDNLTDRLPPLGATGVGAGSGIYEPIGRRLYAGITAKF